MNNLLSSFSVRFNACAKRKVADFFIPYSRLNLQVCQLLLNYNCIGSFTVDVNHLNKKLRIKIKPLYILNEPLVRRVDLISKPGHRVYWTAHELSLNFSRNNFQGFYVISTSIGLCSSNELIAATRLEKPISGEVLLKINL